jgi:chemotaxis protein CheD
MYANSGVPELILRCLELGAQKNRMVVGAAGGASVTNDNGFFNVGEKNLLGLRKALWKSGLVIHRESIGGEVARSVRLDVGTGDLWIKAGRQEAWIFLPRRAASSNSRSCGGVV